MMKLPDCRFHFVLLFLLASSLPYSTKAANCALRNHARINAQLFPKYTSFKTVEGFVDQNAKRVVEQKLGRELSFSEVGNTTMCILYRDEVPLGFVHARSELGSRGSVELVWAIDLDLRITGFEVQRSRERDTNTIREPRFQTTLSGLSWKDFDELLSNQNDRNDQAPLTRLAMECGQKTLLLIEEGFTEEVRNARLIGMMHRHFPTLEKITGIAGAAKDGLFEQTEKSLGRQLQTIDKTGTTVLRARDVDGMALGSLFFLQIGTPPDRQQSYWAISPDGVILGISDPDQKMPEATRNALIGEPLNKISANLEPSHWNNIITELQALWDSQA